jgi:hypothetical protein
MPYPTSIQSFTFKRNNIDKVVADDVNSAYTEITEIQRQLGGVASGGIGVTTSTWGTGTFVYNVSNWLAAGKDGLAQRLANIESGLYEVLATGSTFAKTNIEQTFTEQLKLDGKSLRYYTALQIKESTWTQVDPALSSNRAGLLFGEELGSWSMGQDSQGNGTRDFFVYGGASPTEPNLRFHIAVDGSVSIPNNSLNVGALTTSSAYRIQASAVNAGLGLVSTSSAGSDNRSWIDFVNSSYTQSVRGNIYYNYVDDSLSLGTSLAGSTGARTDRVTINSTGTTFTGTVTVPTGTGSAAPLKFNTGNTKLSTIQAGTVEYDGNVFYATPKVNNTTAGRGLLPTEQVIVLNSNYTPSTLTGTPNETIETSNSAFNKSIYLAASQAYFVDMSVIVYHNMTIASGGSASATFSMSAPTSSTCHITAFSTVNQNTIAGGTANLEFFTGAISGNTGLLITASGTDTGYSILKWSGVIYIGTTAGNFTPLVSRSVTSGASASSAQIVVQAGSYCKVTPLGTYASQINIGGWA